MRCALLWSYSVWHPQSEIEMAEEIRNDPFLSISSQLSAFWFCWLWFLPPVEIHITIVTIPLRLFHRSQTVVLVSDGRTWGTHSRYWPRNDS